MPQQKIMKKICLLGDSAVGKTSLIRKFVLDEFDDNYIKTFGTKVTKKDVNMTAGGASFTLMMMIWDILGQRVRDKLHATYYPGAEGALIVCDLTRRATLESMDEWTCVFKEVCPEAAIVFLANKSDLKDQAAINEKELKAIADRYATSYFITSAKTGENVEKAFMILNNMIIEKVVARRGLQKEV